MQRVYAVCGRNASSRHDAYSELSPFPWRASIQHWLQAVRQDSCEISRRPTSSATEICSGPTSAPTYLLTEAIRRVLSKRAGSPTNSSLITPTYMPICRRTRETTRCPGTRHSRPISSPAIKRNSSLGSDCSCTDGNGAGVSQNNNPEASRLAGKCVARATLGLLKGLTTVKTFRQITWENGSRMFKTEA